MKTTYGIFNREIVSGVLKILFGVCLFPQKLLNKNKKHKIIEPIILTSSPLF